MQLRRLSHSQETEVLRLLNLYITEDPVVVFEELQAFSTSTLQSSHQRSVCEVVAFALEGLEHSFIASTPAISHPIYIYLRHYLDSLSVSTDSLGAKASGSLSPHYHCPLKDDALLDIKSSLERNRYISSLPDASFLYLCGSDESKSSPKHLTLISWQREAYLLTLFIRLLFKPYNTSLWTIAPHIFTLKGSPLPSTLKTFKGSATKCTQLTELLAQYLH